MSDWLRHVLVGLAAYGTTFTFLVIIIPSLAAPRTHSTAKDISGLIAGIAVVVLVFTAIVIAVAYATV
jgi:hypothetical protein